MHSVVMKGGQFRFISPGRFLAYPTDGGVSIEIDPASASEGLVKEYDPRSRDVTCIVALNGRDAPVLVDIDVARLEGVSEPTSVF